jgi:hypothetical protein
VRAIKLPSKTVPRRAQAPPEQSVS